MISWADRYASNVNKRAVFSLSTLSCFLCVLCIHACLSFAFAKAATAMCLFFSESHLPLSVFEQSPRVKEGSQNSEVSFKPSLFTAGCTLHLGSRVHAFFRVVTVCSTYQFWIFKTVGILIHLYQLGNKPEETQTVESRLTGKHLAILWSSLRISTQKSYVRKSKDILLKTLPL